MATINDKNIACTAIRHSRLARQKGSPCDETIAKEDIQETLEEFGYTPHTYVTIDRHDYLANEYEVRALQVMCRRAAQEGKFKEFCEKYKVWDSVDKKYTMIFQPEGCFYNEFSTPFYDTISRMVFETL